MSEPANILERLYPSVGVRSDPEDIDVYADDGDYRAFGFSRKPISSDPMIDFIDRQGTHEALAYGHLYRIRFDASEGITLEFTDHLVTIKGRSLREGYQKLLMQRVVFVAEADRPTAVLVPESEPVVTQLAILPKRELSKQ